MKKKPDPNQQTLFPDPAYEHIVSEIELIYKSKVKQAEMPLISTSSNSCDVFRASWDENKLELCEQFKVMYLNRANRVMGIYHHATGGITGVVADPRLILVTALKLNATSLILAHCHPSGNLNPSREDENLTKKIKAAGDFLDIKVLDHIIITKHGYMSFADQGLI